MEFMAMLSIWEESVRREAVPRLTPISGGRPVIDDRIRSDGEHELTSHPRAPEPDRPPTTVPRRPDEPIPAVTIARTQP
jgi:hypothetical protein